MKKIARPLLILLPVVVMSISTLSEARSFSSRGFGSSKLFKRPVANKAPITPSATTPKAAATSTQNTSGTTGQKGIPGAEQYRALSQQAPSQRLKNAINTRASTGTRLTQLAMLYWLLSSSNSHASELTESDRAWVQKEIKEKEKNGEKVEETPAQTANKP